MHRSLVRVAIALCSLALPARAGAADPACDPEAAIAISVVAELGDADDDRAMQRYLGARLPERLSELGFCPRADASRRLVVTVAWSSVARGDYSISLRAQGPGVEAHELQAESCEACSSPELLDRIAGDLPTVLEGLDAPPSAAVEPPAPPPSTTGRRTSPRPRRSARDRAEGGPRVGIGIGLLASGGAAIATGAALLATGDVPHPANGQYRLDLRPGGAAALAGGIVAAAIGGTLLGVEIRRRRSLALAPRLDRRGGGLSLSGRF